VLLRGALRLATKGVFGIFVFLCAILGYAFGVVLVFAALAKPFFPANTGLWFQDGRFVDSGVLHFPPPAPPSHEVLGMWLIPLALTLGSLAFLFTNWAIRTALRVSQRWQSRL
jgi:hypothetical protein